jgi:hypothetical protein
MTWTCSSVPRFTSPSAISVGNDGNAFPGRSKRGGAFVTFSAPSEGYACCWTQCRPSPRRRRARGLRWKSLFECSRCAVREPKNNSDSVGLNIQKPGVLFNAPCSPCVGKSSSPRSPGYSARGKRVSQKRVLDWVRRHHCQFSGYSARAIKKNK